MPWNYRNVGAAIALVGVFVVAFYASREETPGLRSGAISWKPFDEGVALAHSSNKKIMVDVYTDWCSWCKKMDSEVYTNPDVIKVMNAEFIPVKLNAESSNPVTYRGKSLTEAEFARELGVSGYPTILFFDSDANPITDLPGYSPAQRFTKVLEFIGKDHYKKTSFQEFLAERSNEQ